MLQQELPRIDSSPLEAWSRWLMPALVGAAGLTVALPLALAGQLALAAIAGAAGLAGGVIALVRGSRGRLYDEPIVAGPDYALVGSALGLCKEAAALTSEDGSLLIANAAYRDRFGGARPPLQLGVDEESAHGLELARTMGWRDGAGCVARVKTARGR